MRRICTSDTPEYYFDHQSEHASTTASWLMLSAEHSSCSSRQHSKFKCVRILSVMINDGPMQVEFCSGCASNLQQSCHFTEFISNFEWYVIIWARERNLPVQDLFLWFGGNVFSGAHTDGSCHTTGNGCQEGNGLTGQLTLHSTMLLRNILWDPILKRGNPTKSVTINDFIKSIKKMKFADRGHLHRHGVPLKTMSSRMY